MDARHGGHVCFIVISSTSKDGGAETTSDLQEVNAPDYDEKSNEGVQGVAPKKKQRKIDMTGKFQLEWACKLPWAKGF